MSWCSFRWNMSRLSQEQMQYRKVCKNLVRGHVIFISSCWEFSHLSTTINDGMMKLVIVQQIEIKCTVRFVFLNVTNEPTSFPRIFGQTKKVVDMHALILSGMERSKSGGLKTKGKKFQFILWQNLMFQWVHHLVSVSVSVIFILFGHPFLVDQLVCKMTLFSYWMKVLPAFSFLLFICRCATLNSY